MRTSKKLGGRDLSNATMEERIEALKAVRQPKHLIDGDGKTFLADAVSSSNLTYIFNGVGGVRVVDGAKTGGGHGNYAASQFLPPSIRVYASSEAKAGVCCWYELKDILNYLQNTQEPFAYIPRAKKENKKQPTNPGPDMSEVVAILKDIGDMLKDTRDVLNNIYAELKPAETHTNN